MKVSDWLDVYYDIDGVKYHCGSTRIRSGGDVENIDDRVAFVEKTPRVRIRRGTNYGQWEDFLNWAERPWKGDGPADQESKDWCDAMLTQLGYTV